MTPRKTTPSHPTSDLRPPTSGSTPLAERTPDQIREVLSSQEDAVIESALRLHAYASEYHLGMSKLHHRTGIPSGVLSQFFSGSYKGDFSAVAGRIDKFFWRLEQKQRYGDVRAFAQTRLASVLWALFDKTRVTRRMQIIQSPEQLGKTRAAEEYTARNNSGRTLLVSLSGGSRAGAGDFVWSVAEALGIPYSAKLREKKIRIRQALESCDLVIVDEAHLAWSWSNRSIADFFDYLRTDIHANGARGVVLIATNAAMLDGLRQLRRAAGYNTGQLLGRMRQRVEEIDPAEDIIEDDVSMLAARFYPDGKTPGADLVSYLTGICRRPHLGHYGWLQDVCNEAWSTARGRNQDVTDTIVRQVAKATLAEMSERKELYR